MLTLLVALSASAQDAPDASSRLNAQLFRPAIDAESTLWTEDTHVRPDGYATARSFFQYANAPFRYRNAKGVSQRAISDLAELDVLGAVHWNHIRLGIHAPLYLFAGSPEAQNGAGLGDLALDIKGTLLQREQHPIGLAVSGRLLLPTASVDAALGASGTGWELTAIADRQLGPILLATNLGTRGVPEATYRTVGWGDQVFGRTGAGWILPRDTGVSVDLGWQTNWASAYHPAGTAVELMGGGWLPVGGDLVLRGGLSTGLSRAPGAPLFRGVVGISFEPDPYPDRDLDGLVDREDRCPMKAEDLDGFADADGCPDPTAEVRFALVDETGAAVDTPHLTIEGPEDTEIRSEDDRLALYPGLYDLVATADGYETLRTQFVVSEHDPGMTVRAEMPAKQGAIRVWAVDTSGAAIDATLSVSGGDVVTEANGGEVSVRIGEHALVIAADGFQADVVSLTVARGEVREYTAVLAPAGPRRRVDVGTDRLHLSDKIFFDLNKATIRAESYGLLDEVAAVLLSHPEIRRVEIGGHTDDRGAASLNQRISAERAEAVATYLKGKGVSPTRLHSVGYGETRPIDRAESESAWATNRRVEFRIEHGG